MADKFFQWNKSQSQLVKGLGLGNRLEIFAAETAARYMNPYVPMRDGFLSQNYITGVDDLGGVSVTTVLVVLGGLSLTTFSVMGLGMSVRKDVGGL